MKSKTIKKILQKKFEDFLQSIEDESVKKLVAKNSIITGGCIASMLMKENVNDFDLYFANKETVLKVAEYYVNKFKEANPSYKISVVDVDEMGEDENYYRGRGFTQAGRVGIFCSVIMGNPEGEGILTEKELNIIDEAIGDIKSEKESEALDLEEITGDIETLDKVPNKKYKPLFLSPNAISLSNKVQLILRFYGDAQEIHKNFDFVHATSYWTSSDKQLYLSAKAMESILSKELVYIGSLYPVTSIIRTRKFINIGWTINAGTYLKIMFQISKLDLSNIAVLEDQLIGVDIGYFMALIEALKKAKVSHEENKKAEEFTLEYNYLAEIIDKIFN